MSQLFLYPTVDKLLKVYNIKQIHDMTLDGDLCQNELVYAFSEKKWLSINQIPLFGLLQIDFPECRNQCHQTDIFEPPPIDVSEKIERSMLDEASLLKIYFKKVQHQKTKLNVELDELKTSSHSSEQKASELQAMALQSKQEAQEAKEECEKVLEDYKDLSHEKDQEIMLLKQKNEKLKSFLVAKESYIHQLEEKNSKLKKKLQESLKLKSNYIKIGKDYKGLEKKLKVYQNEITKNKEYIHRLQKVNQQKTDKEVKRLTGESFELSNGKVWRYKQAAKEHGPFDFEEMLELRRLEQISELTLLKNTKTQTGWKALKDHFEFDAPFETIITEENGAPVKRFFIKRKSIRVPIYEIMSLEIEGDEYKGYCTSLSLGGCFMEMTRIKEDQFKKGDEAKIMLLGETFNLQVSANVSIRNISLSRPKGLGLMFDDLNDGSRKIIEKYISESLEKMGIKKEVA